MLSGYQLTEIEKKVEQLYKERQILTPSDLSIKNISEMFNIKVDTSINGGPQRALWDDEAILIFLDPDLTEEKQREVFFHELGHPLMHYGNQTKMSNKCFRELQESQANQFQLYAAIPFFMLASLELPNNEFQLISFISSVFKVTIRLAKKRVEQIKRRIIQTKIDKELTLFAQTVTTVDEKDSFPLLEDLFSHEEINTIISPKNSEKNKVYFDFQDGKPLTLWYCIEIKQGEIHWGKNFKLFPIDANFEFVHINNYTNKMEDAHVVELFLHPSHPNDFAVDIKTLKKKLKFFNVDPYNIRRLVISVQDLEYLLQIPIVSNRLTRCPFEKMVHPALPVTT